ncbi:AAA family ATPase [Massilia sp. PAMC28688]|uniref:AAA family ATPase n=1 Tax=Massilia sp. PAMC28688 TaxID=2861283 RepID=UPI001C636DA6|nr:AAA family ATPase [Massilia sp. PAMC28688]QYF95095.1 AAA family ATPase [Massilia sp. PAMC28688]
MVIQAKPYLREITLDQDAQLDFSRYPFSIPALRNMNVVAPHADVTFFVGENGAGKSTLLEAIAVAMGLPAEGGTSNVSRQQQEVSALGDHLKLVKSFRRPRMAYFLRAESLFNVFTYLDSLGPGSRPSLHLRSHGEAFMDVMLDFKPGGFYLLDEPEAALSPTRQLAALSAIHQLVQQDCQFIIATHSPILLSYPRAKILQFDGEGISEVAYEDTEHVAVTRDFLNHYQRRLERLLADD